MKNRLLAVSEANEINSQMRSKYDADGEATYPLWSIADGGTIGCVYAAEAADIRKLEMPQGLQLIETTTDDDREYGEFSFEISEA